MKFIFSIIFFLLVVSNQLTSQKLNSLYFFFLFHYNALIVFRGVKMGKVISKNKNPRKWIHLKSLDRTEPRRTMSSVVITKNIDTGRTSVAHMEQTWEICYRIYEILSGEIRIEFCCLLQRFRYISTLWNISKSKSDWIKIYP